MGSSSFKLDDLDIQKAVTGALIAGTGAALTYLIQYFSVVDFGPYAVLAAAFLSIATNVLRKFLKNNDA